LDCTPCRTRVVPLRMCKSTSLFHSSAGSRGSHSSVASSIYQRRDMGSRAGASARRSPKALPHTHQVARPRLRPSAALCQLARTAIGSCHLTLAVGMLSWGIPRRSAQKTLLSDGCAPRPERRVYSGPALLGTHVGFGLAGGFGAQSARRCFPRQHKPRGRSQCTARAPSGSHCSSLKDCVERHRAGAHLAAQLQLPTPSAAVVADGPALE